MKFLAEIAKGIFQLFGPAIGRGLLAAAKWIGKVLLAALIFKNCVYINKTCSNYFKASWYE